MLFSQWYYDIGFKPIQSCGMQPVLDININLVLDITYSRAASFGADIMRLHLNVTTFMFGCFQVTSGAQASSNVSCCTFRVGNHVICCVETLHRLLFSFHSVSGVLIWYSD